MSLLDAGISPGMLDLLFTASHPWSDNVYSTKNHYERYIELCEKHGIKGKATVPDGWGENEPR